MINPEVLKFFPEPVLKYKFENYKEFNDKLEKYVYSLFEKDTKGINLSNRGGWHSRNFELNDKESIQFKFGIELQKYILKSFQTLGWKTENKNMV